MEIKESISTMLDQLSSGDKIAAQETFNDILVTKMASALENMKVDVADQMFNSKTEGRGN